MNIVYKSGLSSPDLLPYSRLTEAQLQRAGGEGLFIAESINVILAALEAGYEPVSLLTEEKHLPAIESSLGGMLSDTPVFTAEPELL